VSSPAKPAGHEREAPKEQEEDSSVKGLLVLFIAFGLILIVGSLAFRAEGGATRAALLLLAFAMFLMTMVWFGWVNRYLSGVARGTTLGILALVVAGPVAGVLIARFGPRTLVAGGVAAVGVGNLVAAALLGPRVPYVGLVLPFVLIGAGFVIATTVRTAIIFASVPRGLPATAAALNEASITMGSRVGLVVVTAAISQLALDSFSASLGGLDPAQADAATAAFRDVLIAIGTPAFGQLVSGIGPADASAYAEAYTQAIRVALAVTGAMTVVAAVIAWLAIGRRDPLATVWEHQDERMPATAVPTAPGPSSS